ncbi:RRQRL motif-containing zinc-binding protein [Streptomyces sp. NPDC050743]|uniref:RRQRL motif-containing zinc-binding protein n=1 Tax=Streptomyces sp. NPDC050743 TaxID=3365634 RepID=UPI0037B40D5A
MEPDRLGTSVEPRNAGALVPKEVLTNTRVRQQPGPRRRRRARRSSRKGPVPAGGLATRRQLRALGLSPGGHDPVARLICRGGQRWAWLYRVDLAAPKRTPTLAQEMALDRAMAARQTCPECRRRYYACLPLRTQGRCDACERGFEPSPDTVMIPAPAVHRLVA